MAIATRTEQVVALDGGTLGLRVAAPEAGRGPGLLLLQEIFGVTGYIRRRAEDLAGLGYVVACPDVFWRLQPGLDLPHDEEGLATALGVMGRFDFRQGLSDLDAAFGHLQVLPEVAAAGGRAGLIGFCLGGTLAWQMALRVDAAAAVCYYGSGIQPASSDEVPSCPVLLHFGGGDAYIAWEQVDRVAAATAGCPNVDLRRYPGAGHAFDNDSEMFHHLGAAAAAWDVTVAFLARTLPAVG
jgi:carboxymethylenebutenolidase